MHKLHHCPKPFPGPQLPRESGKLQEVEPCHSQIYHIPAPAGLTACCHSPGRVRRHPPGWSCHSGCLRWFWMGRVWLRGCFTPHAGPNCLGHQLEHGLVQAQPARRQPGRRREKRSVAGNHTRGNTAAASMARSRLRGLASCTKRTARQCPRSPGREGSAVTPQPGLGKTFPVVIFRSSKGV